jgi:hypothetical protein
MTMLVPANAFGAEVLAHLDAQLLSARRLLSAVLEQGAAIRAQEVETVLDRLTEIQAEVERRGALEQQRAGILGRAGQALGVPAHVVTLEAMSTLLGDGVAAAARERSAELRGMLEQIAREHRANRALMKQELAFLDHLMRQLGAGGDETGAYGANGMATATRADVQLPAVAPAAQRPSILDMRA